MGKFVQDYMSRVYTIKKDTPIKDAIKYMLEEATRIALIVDDIGCVKGIVTGTDLVREGYGFLSSSKSLDGTIEHIMTTTVFFQMPENTLMVEAVKTMANQRAHDMVVVKISPLGIMPIGILRQLDAMRWWWEEFGTNK